MKKPVKLFSASLKKTSLIHFAFLFVLTFLFPLLVLFLPVLFYFLLNYLIGKILLNHKLKLKTIFPLWPIRGPPDLV